MRKFHFSSRPLARTWLSVVSRQLKYEPVMDAVSLSAAAQSLDWIPRKSVRTPGAPATSRWASTKSSVAGAGKAEPVWL